MPSILYPGKAGGSIDTKTALKSRILLGYSGNSTNSDMGGLLGVGTTATVSSAQVKLGSNSLSFNNQNSALTFRINETLRQLDKFSISCWARFNSFNYGGPWSSWDANTLASGQLNLLNEGGTTPTTFAWYVSGSNFYSLSFGSGAVVANQWYWFLCELDRVNLTASAYLNNVLASTATLSPGFILNTGVDTFALGGYQLVIGGVTNMNGFVDEFAILLGNMSATERDWMWNAGNGNSLV
jgi:hypothetical protein